MSEDLRNWKVFVRIVERGSFARAAEDMRLDASVVSRCMAALEHQLKVQLITRSTRSISLTPEGSRAYERMLPLLEQVDAAVADLSKLPDSPLSGTVRITAPVNFGERYIARWLASFQRMHPEVIFDLVLSDRCVDLVQEGIDLAVRIGYLPDSELVARRIGEMPGVICASPDYLKAFGTPCEPADLSRHRAIIYSWRQDGSPTRLTLDKDKHSKTVELRGTFFSNHVGAIHQATLDGAGFHAGPTWLFGEAIEKGELVRILPDWSLPVLPVHILRLKHPYVPTRITALSDWLGSCWKQESGLRGIQNHMAT